MGKIQTNRTRVIGLAAIGIGIAMCVGATHRAGGKSSTDRLIAAARVADAAVQADGLHVVSVRWMAEKQRWACGVARGVGGDVDQFVLVGDDGRAEVVKEK